MHRIKNFTPVDTREIMVGNQYIFRFDNNYGASVLQYHDGTYTNEGGPWNIAIIKFEDESNTWTMHKEYSKFDCLSISEVEVALSKIKDFYILRTLQQ